MNTSSFELQPHMLGALVSLRPLRSEDFDQLFAVASDPLIWEQHPASDRYQEPVFRKFFDEAMQSGGAFIIQDLETGAVIGSSRYANLSTERSEVEIGWTFLARAYWGGKYNTELKALMLRHAFRFVDSVVFIVGAQNHRSQRAVLKLGAAPEPYTSGETDRDVLCFRLSRESFLHASEPARSGQ